MADLDDFFAKKDRKKPKGKKFTTTEEIAKKLEGKKLDKPKKEKPNYQSNLTGQLTEEDAVKSTVEEEEWKEFQEEKKDYTGLKIQNLSLQEQLDEESEQNEVEGEGEENEQGETVRRKKGPWKSIEAEPSNPTSQGVNNTELAPTNSGGKYLSPHLRMQRVTKSSAAPDIMNTEFFPTLSSTTYAEGPVAWGKSKKSEGMFEEVRNSKSHSNRNDGKDSETLEIGNKFGALQSETS